MNILLACDLDGTLLDHTHQVDSQSLAKIKNFCEEGNTLIIATGRLDHDITFVENHLGFFGLYRISQNGAVVKTQAGEIIVHKAIDEASVNLISDFFAKTDLRVEASTADNRYFPSPRKEGEVGEYYDSSIISARFYEDIKKLPISTFLIFGTPELFIPIRAFIGAHLSQQVDGFMTSPVSFEIVAKGVNKGAAVQDLVTKMAGIQKFDLLAAIGDSENDTSMFPVVDYSFAVSHAKEEIRNQAGHTVPTVGAAIDILMKVGK
ncbi:MAG: HAD-IIB family hydrolase [Culicoidibacterales bacterium]